MSRKGRKRNLSRNSTSNGDQGEANSSATLGLETCCASGMFVQSVEFIEAHATSNGNPPARWHAAAGKAWVSIGIYGQELNYTIWGLPKMNLAVHSIAGHIEQGDSFLNERFPNLKADYILANPPFNMKEWGGEHLREDKRGKFGVPPARNANFAWVQHKESPR